MYLTTLAADVSFLDGIRPGLPDFLQKEIAGPLGAVLAVGFIAMFVVGVVLATQIALNHNNGDASTSTSKIVWWISGIIFLAALISIIRWVAN